MRGTFEDFTGQDILEGAYSYENPSWIVANALVNGMIHGGLTKEQAITVFYSKAIRWSYDGDLTDKLENVGFKWGKKLADEYKDVSWLNEPLEYYIQRALDKHNEREESY